MASGGKRGAGERVLESKHVIGLFLLMLLFSGVFFTLGYVMGRNQYDGQVSAATTNARTPEREPVVPAKAGTRVEAHRRSSPSSDRIRPRYLRQQFRLGILRQQQARQGRAASGPCAESARDSTGIENG